MPKFFARYHLPLLLTILFFAFATRIIRLEQPPTYIFDEVYHAVTAKLMARNDPRAFEWWNPPVEPNTSVDWLHPPLAKYTQALSIKIFGETSFGWRLSSALFGVGVILLIYKIAFALFNDYRLSLLASLLASFDGLLLTQSRIAMNDIHVTFFILLSFFFYLKYLKNPSFLPLLLTGVVAGLAMGSKWSGIFILLLVIISEGKKILSTLPATLPKLSHLLRLAFCLIFIPVTLYVLSYSQMFLQGKGITHFFELHRQIWWYQTNLEATHPYQSRPWEWFLNLKPVWYHVETSDRGLHNIYAGGNTVLYWLGGGAVIFSLGLIVLAKFTKFKAPPHFKLFLLTYLIVWLPWQFSPRIMFFYHYTPAVPFLAIILAFYLNKLLPTSRKNCQPRQLLGLFALIACGLNFLIFYPHWTGLTVPKEIFEPIYFAFKNWK